MNVLVIQLRRVGDVLMTTPALRALKSRFPQAEITYVCERPFSPVLRANADVDTLLPLEAGAGLKERLRLAATLRERGFDLALDFEGSGVSAALTAASAATRRVGYRGRVRAAAYTDRVDAEPLRRGSLAAEKLALLAPLGIDPRTVGARPTLAVDARAREWVARSLEAAGVTSATFLLTVAPWARSSEAAWPLERFAGLLDLLAGSFELETVLLLRAGDDPLAERLGRLTRVPLFQLSTPPSLLQLAALLDRADLHVGNENAPRHMAAALGTATLTLYAPGARRRWSSPGDPLQPGLEPDVDGATRPASAALGTGSGPASPATAEAGPAISRIAAEAAFEAVLALKAYLPRLGAARRTAVADVPAAGPESPHPGTAEESPTASHSGRGAA
ncbi:MAG: glycosyltransferase family 9 protein [Gemmatimonadota bacterium]